MPSSFNRHPLPDEEGCAKCISLLLGKLVQVDTNDEDFNKVNLEYCTDRKQARDIDILLSYTHRETERHPVLSVLDKIFLLMIDDQPSKMLPSKSSRV